MGENATLEVVEDLKELGFRYATQAGISIGMNDLKTPPSKSFFVSQAEKNMRLTEQEFLGGRITATEKSQRVVDTWHRTSELLKQEVVDHFRLTDSLNPVYVMALSGARGNFSQVRQLVGMRGLMADPQGLIISFPIRSNFREGLTLTEYFISCYGARKGLVDTALRTADTGYLTRRLVDVSHHVVVRKATCKTQHGIFLTELRSHNNTKKPILSLKERLIGRVLAATIPLETQDSFYDITNRRLAGTIVKRDREISVDLAEKIAALGKPVFVRSPLTCSLRFDICQLCYGWSLSQGKLVTIGEAVGIIAAQSIGEPGTQLTMRTFHTGGVFSGDLLEEMSSPFSGYIGFPTPFQGLLIRTPHGRIAFLTKTSGLMVLTALRITMDPLERGTLNVVSPFIDKRDKISKKRLEDGTLRASGNQSNGTTKTSKTRLSQDQRFGVNNLTDNLEIRNKSNSKNSEPGKKVQFVLEPSTVLFVRQGEKVSKGQLLAQFSAIDEEQNERIQSKQILFAELSGQIYVESLVQKTKKDPKTGYQQKLSKTLGFVWIFSGREFPKKNCLALYKRKNGHLVDIQSIQFRLYRMKGSSEGGTLHASGNQRKRFVTNLGSAFGNTEGEDKPLIRSNDLSSQNKPLNAAQERDKNQSFFKVSNKRIAALFDIFPPTQIFEKTILFYQTNYKNNFGYAFSLFPLRPFILKNKKSEKYKHLLYLCKIPLTFTLLFRSWVDTENRTQENNLNKENFGFISIRAPRLDKNLDKVFLPQTMFSLSSQDFGGINHASLGGDQLFQNWSPLGKAPHELQKNIENLYSNNSAPQKTQRSKNRHLLTQDQSFFNLIVRKHSVIIDKQKISKFLFLLFLGESSLPSGGRLEFNELYSERKKEKGHLFWLPQENYQVVSLFPLPNKRRYEERDLYKNGSNSLDTQKGLRRSLLKRALLTSGKGRYILHCFRPIRKNQQFSPTQPFDSSSPPQERKNVLNSQRVRLLVYGPFVTSPISLQDGPALYYHERVSRPTPKVSLEIKTKTLLSELAERPPKNLFESCESTELTENKRQSVENMNSKKSEGLLSIIGFWGHNKVPLGSALNLQGDLVSIFSRSSGWFTRYSILSQDLMRENLEERDLPRFTTNSKRLFPQLKKTLEIFSQRPRFGKETDRILWTNLEFVRSSPLVMASEVLDSTTPRRRDSASRIFRNNFSYSLRSNPCVQKHKAVLKASFHPLGSFVTDRKEGTCGSYSKNLITTNKGSCSLSPVLSFHCQRLALLNLLPSPFFVRMKWMKCKKRKRTNQNYCLKVRPGWFYLPKIPHIFTTKERIWQKESNSVIDDIAFEQAKMNVEFVRFSDSPFYLSLKELSAISISSRKITLSPLKIKRDQIPTSLDDIWKNFCKESNARSSKKTAFPFKEFNKTTSIQTDCWTGSNLSRNKENTPLSSVSPEVSTLSQKEESLNKNKVLVVALEKNTQLGIIGQLTSKKRKLPHYFFLRDGLGKDQNSLESGLDQSVLLLIRQLLWTDSESFPLVTESVCLGHYKDWDFTPQQFDTLGWLREYRISTAVITNSRGRFSSICLPVSSWQKTSSSFESYKGKSKISKTKLFISRFFPPLQKEMYSFEINQVLFDTSLSQGKNLSIRLSQKVNSRSILEEEKTVNKKSFFETYLDRKKRFQTAVLFQKVDEKIFVDVPTCKKLLYGTQIDLIEGKTKERNKNYSNQQRRMPLYAIAPGARLNISRSFSFGTEMSEVFSLAPFHFTRLAINFTSSFVHSLVTSKKSKTKLTTWMVEPATASMRQNKKGSTTEHQLVAPHVLSLESGKYVENRDFKKYSKDDLTLPTSPSMNLRLMSRSSSREDDMTNFQFVERETKQGSVLPFSYKNFDTEQETKLEDLRKKSFPISLKGEVVRDPLGYTVLFNSDQVSFFTEPQRLQVVPGQLVRSGEEITVKRSPNELEKMKFDGRNDNDMRLAVDRSGQILKIERNQITLRKAQAVLFYSQAVSHVSHGQWVTSGSPILTLTHQTLVTGDIVQGIPKIEQFFEASATKQGIPLAGNLHRKLQTIFKENKKDLPRPEAVRKSLEDIQQVLVEGIQRVYLSQGVLIADKHLEVIVRQMTAKGKIIESGDTGLFHGEFVAIRRIEGVNLMTPGKKAVYVPAVVGLTRTSLDSESFISAASFQETTRVLTRDVILGKTDFLRGLKEKVVLGDLISAGTGLENYLMYNLVMRRAVKR